MPSMDAILRIRARAEGKGEIADLDRAMRRLGPGAESSAHGVGRLNSMLGQMGTIAGGIGLAGLGAGLLRFGGESIKAGDEAVRFEQRLKVLADRFGETGKMMDFIAESSDRYSIGLLETGEAYSFLYAASREMVSGGEEVQTTFRGIMNLARQVGLPIYEAREAMRQWTQSIGEGRLNGQEYVSMMQRIPTLNRLLVRAFNELRQESGQPLITKATAEQMVAAVKEGEKRQTEEIKKGILERKNAAERETEQVLSEIEKRYERQRRIISDRNEDVDNDERKARDKRAEDEREAIERRYDEERKLYERQFEDRRDQFLKNNQSLSEEALKQAQRSFEDQKEIDLRNLEERKELELEALKDRFDAESIERARALRDQRQQQEDALAEQQQSEETKIRESLEKRRQELDFDLKRQVDSTTKANEEIIAGILSRVQVTEGQLKKLAEEGKISANVMTRVMQIASKETKFADPTPLDRLTKSLSDLRLEIGDNLQPLLNPLAAAVDTLVRGFGAMPEPVQATVVGLLALGGAGGGLMALLGTVGQIKALTMAFRGLSGAAKLAQETSKASTLGKTSLNPFSVKQIVPPLAPPPPGMFKGLLAEIGQVGIALRGISVIGMITSMKTALMGFVGWVASTFLPPLIALFSGPAGWIMLAVAAIVTGVVLFREPILKFLGWVVGGFIEMGKNVGKAIYDFLIKPVVNFFGGIWDQIKTPLDNLRQNLTWLFTTIAKGIIGILYVVFLKPWVDLFVNLRNLIEEPLMSALEAIGAFFTGLLNAIIEKARQIWQQLSEVFYIKFILPFQLAWEGISEIVLFALNLIKERIELVVGPIIEIIKGISNVVKTVLDFLAVLFVGAFQKILDDIDRYFVKPLQKIWAFMTQPPEQFIKKVTAFFTKFFNIVVERGKGVMTVLQTVFNNTAGWIVGGMQRVIASVTNGVNAVIRAYNRVANLTKNAGFKLPVVAELEVPSIMPEIRALARGAFVSMPTIALVGEGKNPNEYVIPEGSMEKAVAGWQAGLRENQLAAYWQSPGLAPGSSVSGGWQPITLTAAPVHLNISGGVIQLADGREAVTLEQVHVIAQGAAAQGGHAAVAAIMSHLTSGAGRSRLRQ